MPSDNGRIDSNNMTFYVLNNDANREYYETNFPYFNGIGINKNYNEILYYYICPD